MPLLNEDERRILLGLARQALEAGVRGEVLSPEAPELPAALQEHHGIFVTLHAKGHLRGCIGHIQGDEPLYRSVQECAIAAALADPRFPSVSPEEVPSLTIEISVLSEMQAISPQQVEVGKHGLLISRGIRRGLLLPQVAVEWDWDREKFLEETCLKAGLPFDAWRHGAKVEAFTAEVFGEPIQTAARVPTASAPGPRHQFPGTNSQ